MKPYDLAIFDFDGTLADSLDWFLGELPALADRFGFRRVDAAEQQALRACDTREILRRLGIPAWKLPMIARHLRRRMATEASRIALFPGADAMLAELDAGGVRIAIVSSNAEATVRTVLGPTRASRVAAFGCGAALFGKAPFLRRTVRRCAVAPARALFVGDERRDVDAARAAGIDSGAALWGYAAADALRAAGPTHVFAAMAEIAARLLPVPPVTAGSRAG